MGGYTVVKKKRKIMGGEIVEAAGVSRDHYGLAWRRLAIASDCSKKRADKGEAEGGVRMI